MTREYTVLAVISVVGVLLFESLVLRTGLLRTRPYWIALAICFGFMIAVNGWLTKLSAPIVLYDERRTTGWRFPWDIPVEDYLFGFSLLTLAMLSWDSCSPGHRRKRRFLRRRSAKPPSSRTARDRTRGQVRSSR